MLATTLWAVLLVDVVSASPTKVFILAGQSNMQGHGFVQNAGSGHTMNGTLEYLTTDPRTKAEFSKLKRGGNWVSRKDVWMYYDDTGNPQKPTKTIWHGNLTVGYAGNFGKDDKVQMGPEMGLGWVLGDALEEQVLMIKMAWGGKSLDGDFRPPSSGGTVGPFYTKMIQGVQKALNDLPKNFPSYSGSYELTGLFWHQGWNDGCSGGKEYYEKDLANLIRDVRKDLGGLPGGKQLPFSIGVSGMLGFAPYESKCANVAGGMEKVIHAQFAVADSAKYP
jgi:alpha-galactosidase